MQWSVGYVGGVGQGCQVERLIFFVQAGDGEVPVDVLIDQAKQLMAIIGPPPEVRDE